MAEYDVIVIGGGISGVSCAAYLGKAAQKGFDVNRHRRNAAKPDMRDEKHIASSLRAG